MTEILLTEFVTKTTLGAMPISDCLLVFLSTRGHVHAAMFIFEVKQMYVAAIAVGRPLPNNLSIARGI